MPVLLKAHFCRVIFLRVTECAFDSFLVGAFDRLVVLGPAVEAHILEAGWHLGPAGLLAVVRLLLGVFVAGGLVSVAAAAAVVAAAASLILLFVLLVGRSFVC